MKVKDIDWTEEFQPHKHCSYNHLIGRTGLGDFQIEWKGWKTYDGRCIYLCGDYLETVDSTEEAKIWCSNYFTKLVNSCLQ